MFEEEEVSEEQSETYLCLPFESLATKNCNALARGICSSIDLKPWEGCVVGKDGVGHFASHLQTRFRVDLFLDRVRGPHSTRLSFFTFACTNHNSSRPEQYARSVIDSLI